MNFKWQMITIRFDNKTAQMKNESKWLANFECLKVYISEHHHLPPPRPSEKCLWEVAESVVL